MNLDFFENLINHNEHKKNKEIINNEKINEEEVKLAYKLGAIEIYTVDRIEENVAVLQNNETKQIKNINIEELPEEIKDGTVLKCINGKFFLDKETEEEISKQMEEKMNRLWN